MSDQDKGANPGTKSGTKSGTAGNDEGARWVTIGATGPTLAPGELRTVKREGHQLVIGRAPGGALFALDNRCPHEGYPLAQGLLAGDQLTCRWHNWKFRVGDGRCLIGGEDVRCYPVREGAEDSAIEVDLAGPDPAVEIPRLRESFLQGVSRHENDRAIRDGARLLLAGFDPRRLLVELAVHDARHGEYGSTHTLALAGDCARLLHRFPGAQAMHAIAPVIDLCGDEVGRLPAQTTAPPIQGGSASSFRRAVEDEELATAEGLLRGALAAGMPPSEVTDWLYAALSDHFTDFGHPLIYLVKAEELLRGLDPTLATEILVGLTRSLVLATREDTLPYLAVYRARLDAMAGELGRLFIEARPGAPFDGGGLRDAVLDGSSGEALDALCGALEGGVSGACIARVLVAAGAHRLLRFDERLENDPGVAENWLWATHRLTFTSAVRNACERFRSPDALRFLFQALAFVHSGRAMDMPAERRQVLLPDRAHAGLEDLRAAVHARDVTSAVARTLGHLESGQPFSELAAELEDLALTAPLARPIFLAHAVKTVLAGIEECRVLEGDPDRVVPLVAAVRFLASPVVGQRLSGLVASSLAWVVDGVMPRKLTQ